MLLEPSERRLIVLTEPQPASAAEVGLATCKDVGFDHQL